MFPNFDVFSLIFDELNYNEAIRLRGVCKQWKLFIDEYLKKQKVLSVFDNGDIFFF